MGQGRIQLVKWLLDAASEPLDPSRAYESMRITGSARAYGDRISLSETDGTDCCRFPPSCYQIPESLGFCQLRRNQLGLTVTCVSVACWTAEFPHCCSTLIRLMRSGNIPPTMSESYCTLLHSCCAPASSQASTTWSNWLFLPWAAPAPKDEVHGAERCPFNTAGSRRALQDPR